MIFDDEILLEILPISNLADAIANLFFYFFVFNFEYPGRFKQCLGFFHSFIFKFEKIEIKKNDTFLELETQILNS